MTTGKPFNTPPLNTQLLLPPNNIPLKEPQHNILLRLIIISPLPRKNPNYITITHTRPLRQYPPITTRKRPDFPLITPSYLSIIYKYLPCHIQ